MGSHDPAAVIGAGIDPTAFGMAGPNRMKEAEIRAGVGVSFTRHSEPEAQVKPAVALTDPVAASRSLGAVAVLGEEAWGVFDQTLTKSI